MKIDPDRVRAIGGEAGDAAKTAGRAHTSRAAALAPADGAGVGWSAAVAARSAWEPFVRRLGEAIGEFGTALAAAADEYVASDDQAAASLRGLR